MKTKSKLQTPELSTHALHATLRSFFPICQTGANFNKETANGLLIGDDTPSSSRAKTRCCVHFVQPANVPFLASDKQRAIITDAQTIIRKTNEKIVAELLNNAGFKASICREGGVNVRE